MSQGLPGLPASCLRYRASSIPRAKREIVCRPCGVFALAIFGSAHFPGPHGKGRRVGRPSLSHRLALSLLLLSDCSCRLTPTVHSPASLTIVYSHYLSSMAKSSPVKLCVHRSLVLDKQTTLRCVFERPIHRLQLV